jgi:hypothetical protein
MNKFRFIFPLMLLLAACSPIYTTDYSFDPPPSNTGRTCVLQCENSKLLCDQLVESRYDSCLQRAELQYQSCESRKIYKIDYDSGNTKCVQNCYCYRDSCSKDETTCGTQYRTCYQTCGGKVTSKTYCTSNCEEVGGVGAPPPGAVSR